jgi:hypothetical protein
LIPFLHERRQLPPSIQSEKEADRLQVVHLTLKYEMIKAASVYSAQVPGFKNIGGEIKHIHEELDDQATFLLNDIKGRCERIHKRGERHTFLSKIMKDKIHQVLMEVQKM